MGYGKLLQGMAVKSPEFEIVKQAEKVYTLDQLNKYANQVANALIGLGIQKGEKFGILLYNSPEYLEILFGLQKTGAVPVPISTRYGLTEFQYIFENTNLSGLFLDKEFINKIKSVLEVSKSGVMKHIFVLNSISEEELGDWFDYEKLIRNQETIEPEIQVDDEEVGLIIYTGGTTGFPKGVVMTHANLQHATVMVPKHGINLVMTNKVKPEALLPRAGQQMKILVPTPMFHISGIMAVLTQLSLRYLVIFPEKSSFDLEEICRIIQEEKVTSIFMVPTMYRMLLNYPELDNYDFSSMTMIISGGEELTRQMKIGLLERFPEKTLLDGYGSTETMGTSTIAFMNYEDIPKIKEGYIGQVITGVKMRIVNERGEEVPVGEIGEMVYKSKTIMQGYYKDEVKNKESFDEEGWFHSGDLGKIDAEGNVYYQGRINEMITSGGEKISPTEVEEILREHPKIAEAAITGVPDKIWGEIVTALIELKPGEKMSPQEVINYCKGKIATYKKPRIVHFVDHIPVTNPGKLNRTEIRNLVKSLNFMRKD